MDRGMARGPDDGAARKLGRAAGAARITGALRGMAFTRDDPLNVGWLGMARGCA
jgi:hypothetical protein